MSETIPKEKLPEQEYRGTLRDASDFGENVFAITIQSDGAEDLHVGPFQFERPIGLYVGQQVAVWIGGERTEKGVFPARIRWTNPMPSVRGGKTRPLGKATGRNKPAPRKPSTTATRPKKGETRKRRKAMLREMLASGDAGSHAVNDVCFALNLRLEEIPGLLGLESGAVTRPLLTSEVEALQAAKYPPKVATAPLPTKDEAAAEEVVAAVEEEKAEVAVAPDAADYVAAVAALKEEFDALENLEDSSGEK